MRKSTSIAVRATATVAGVAALGATFAGTASAEQGFGDVFGGSSNSESDSGLDMFDSSGFDQSGLMDFEMPSFQSKSTDMRGSSPLDDLGGFGDEDNEDNEDDDDDDADDDEYCGEGEDEEETDYGVFQNPVQCKNNDFGKGDFEVLGHSFGE